MLIETITMVKGEDVIVVNASERAKYVEAGYENEKPKVPVGEPAKTAAEPTKTAEPAKAAGK